MAPLRTGLIALAAWGCDDAVSSWPEVPAGDDTGSVAEVAMSLEASEITYTLSHDWSGTEDVGSARVVTNDLGVRFGVVQAVLATTSLEMVPCEVSDPLLRHGSGDHDVSHLLPDTLVDLLGPDTTFRPVPSSEQPYCAVVEVLGPVGEEGVVVRFSGWFELPGDDTRTALLAQAPVPLSGIHLPAAGSGPGDAEMPAEVVITRHLATAFDGIDPAVESELDVAYSFGWNVVWGTTAAWHEPLL
ncbi:MAG: hypothetical protein KTR31_41245 [Myxococcales bacterium]|nr:hypothetical protein [Myxococcales bacterium]